MVFLAIRSRRTVINHRNTQHFNSFSPGIFFIWRHINESEPLIVLIRLSLSLYDKFKYLLRDRTSLFSRLDLKIRDGLIDAAGSILPCLQATHLGSALLCHK